MKDFIRKNWLILAVSMVVSVAQAQTTNTFPSNGNVGIGTTSTPGALLQVGSTYSQNPSIMIGGQDSNNSSTGYYSLLFGAFRDVESITSGIVATPVWTCCGGYPASGYPGVRVNTLGFYTAYNPANPTAHSPSMVINEVGNVGIGTTTPGTKLEVWAGSEGQSSPVTALKIDGPNSPGGANSAQDIRFGFAAAGSAGVRAYRGGSWDTYLQFFTNPSYQGSDSPQVRMTIDHIGNIGIGTTAPVYRLDVAGQIHTSGSVVFADGSTQSTAWTGSLCGGDYAESVDVTGDRRKYEPGDVLVIDPDVSGKFLKSAEPYSTAVTGIYSTKPGAVGRRQTTPKNPEEVPMAMIGIVPTKVSAENGPIHRGDLLVTSSTMGYAMKGTDRSRLTGAVIGKALDNLESGKGVIEVVVTLQ